jgi:ABC-type multidrug transport system ATPase subunit
MSGGEQAMVSIGRGLMRAPKLLLIDEPSLGLSPLLVKENFSIIRGINERGITVFLVEQNVHQTLEIAHFGYVLSKGRVVAAGTPGELAGRAEVREAYFGRGIIEWLASRPRGFVSLSGNSEMSDDEMPPELSSSIADAWSPARHGVARSTFLRPENTGK